MTDSLAAYTDTLIFNPKLGKLNPIIMPEPIKFEPITAGWYILLGLIVLLLLFIAYRRYKKFRSQVYRRLSVQELKKIIPEIGKSSPAALIQQVSAILKVTAIKSFSREKVAKLSGADWQSFLTTSFRSGSYYKDAFALIDFQYVPESELQKVRTEDINKLIDASIKWIRGHHV